MQPPVTIEAAILLALAAEPSHGRAILERLRRCAGGHMRMAEGSLYEHLHELERLGLTIRALPRDNRKRHGRPPIRYALTADGRLRAREHYFFLKRLLKIIPAEAPGIEVKGG